MDAPSISAAELTRAIQYRRQERDLLAKQLPAALPHSDGHVGEQRRVEITARIQTLDAEIKALTDQLSAKDNPPK